MKQKPHELSTTVFFSSGGEIWSVSEAASRRGFRIVSELACLSKVQPKNPWDMFSFNGQNLPVLGLILPMFSCTGYTEEAWDLFPGSYTGARKTVCTFFLIFVTDIPHIVRRTIEGRSTPFFYWLQYPTRKWVFFVRKWGHLHASCCLWKRFLVQISVGVSFTLRIKCCLVQNVPLDFKSENAEFIFCFKWLVAHVSALCPLY